MLTKPAGMNFFVFITREPIPLLFFLLFFNNESLYIYIVFSNLFLKQNLNKH